MRILSILSLLFISGLLVAQNVPTQEEVSYKEMMYDPAYNFYEVVAAAEKHFESIDKDKKGSGWKPYQRWRVNNEYKYYPSGDRSQVDPYFVRKQYQEFLKNHPKNKNLFQGKWEDLGPSSVDSITGNYSVGLGRIEDNYTDPNDTNRLYFGSRSGGFWYSLDGGDTWTVSTDTLFATGVNTFSVSPTNPDSILINVRNARNGYSHGIYRSVDGGNSWSASNFNPANLGFGGLGSSFQIYKIAYHPRVPDLVFVGTNVGIYRSTDNLATWSRTQVNYDFTRVVFHPTNDSIVYLYNTAGSSTSNRIFRSTDQGLSYAFSNQVPGNGGNESVELKTSPDCPSCLYFASTNGVWLSTDEGVNFQFLSNPNVSCDGFAVSDLDTSNMVYGNIDLFASTNGGRNFTQRTEWSLGNTNGSGSGNAISYATSTDYIHADLRNASALNGVFYAATDGFLAKSKDNGVSWDLLNDGTGIRENYCLGLSQSNHFRTICGSQDNGSSFMTEAGWVEFFGADGMEGVVHPLNDDWMMASFQYGGRRLTKDGGFSQQSATPSGSSNAYWIAPLAYDPNDHMRLYDFRDIVYRTDNFGESFVVAGSPASFSGDIQEAAIAENNSQIMVVARGASIDLTTNGGLSFQSIRQNLPGSSIQDIAFSPLHDSTIIVVYGNYQNDGQKIFITHDLGQSWNNISHNLGSMPIRSVVIDNSAAENIYIGAEIGIYIKAMNANSWNLYSNGLPNVAILELEINYGSNTLRAASWGRGLWEMSLQGRAAYPAITYTTITDPPTDHTPKFSVDQYVTSRIHYTGTLSSVYVDWSRDSAVFGNTINMSNTVDSTWESNSPLPNFPVGTKLYFKVVAVGANNDTTETYKFMYEVQPYDYCNATGNSSSGNLFISRVDLSNVNNFSGNNAYSLYSSPLINLAADSLYSITLAANTGWSRNDLAAWIDYNNDRSFANEEAIVYAPNIGNGVIDTFRVPNTVVAGDTARMRVRLSYWSDPQACGNVFGEVEDYLVYFSPVITSINEQDALKGIRLYPNPTEGNFTLDFGRSTANHNIRIFSANGQMVFEQQQVGKGKLQLNAGLTNGYYYVVIANEKGSISLPLAVME